MHRRLKAVLLSTVILGAIAAPAFSTERTIPIAALNENFRLQDIEVEGSSRKDQILLSMTIKPGSDVTLADLQDQQRRIYALGYFTDLPRFARLPGVNGDRLVVHVEENSTVTGLEISGNSLVSTDKIKPYFEPLVGDTLNLNTLSSAAADLEKRYKDSGYSLAKVTQKSLRGDGTLMISVTEGLIDGFSVSGNKRTQSDIVLREITQKPGQYFNMNTLMRDTRRIGMTGLFDDVSMRAEPSDRPDAWKITLDVKERQTAEVNFGAGYNTSDGVYAMGRLQDQNFLGRAIQSGLDLNIGFKRFLFKLDWNDPWALPNRTAFGGNLMHYRTYNSFLSYIDQRTGLQLNVGKPLGDPMKTPWRGFAGVRAQLVSVLDLQGNPDATRTLNPNGRDRIYGATFGLRYDTRNDPLNPKDGLFGQVSFDPTGGDAYYGKLNFELNNYWTLTDWLTLALGSRYGAIAGKVPVYDRFYGVGNTIVRGFADDGHLSGDNLLLGSAEVRFPIYNIVSGAAFVDAGNFWNQGTAPTDWLLGSGLGVRLDTPMGVLRFDYGWQILGDKPGQGQLHFSMGQKF